MGVWDMMNENLYIPTPYNYYTFWSDEYFSGAKYSYVAEQVSTIVYLPLVQPSPHLHT